MGAYGLSTSVKLTLDLWKYTYMHFPSLIGTFDTLKAIEVFPDVLRTGSSRDRHVQARSTALLWLSMRTSWLAMCLVNSLILRARWGVLSWIMVAYMDISAGEVARAAGALYDRSPYTL